jgi:drug/metabolite transporter (DMT)-like permease
MTADRPVLGIALMLGFCALAPLADAMVKLLGPHMAIGQIVLLRFAFQALILVPVVLVTGRCWRMTRRVTWLIAARTVLHVLGIGLMVAALMALPLADAIAIAYVMPFFLLLLGYWFLGETVGWRRIAACIVGFAGTLLIVQPAFHEVGWPALLPLAVALTFALFMLVTRQIATRSDAITMQAISALMALAVMVPVMALAQIAPPPLLDWRPMAPDIWMLMLGMGIAGTTAHLLMTWAVRYAPTATLAPVQYAEIPVAALIGWLVFADLPGPLATVGIAVTTAAGLYVILRERASQPVPAAKPPA